MLLDYNKKMTPEEALDSCCRWILEQEYDSERGKFLYCGPQVFEWYMIFYALRCLSLGGKLLNKPEYIRAAEPYLDCYCREQLPNGALSSKFRGKPGAEMTVQEVEDEIRNGKLNLADNGTNTHAVLQAAMLTDDPERRELYLSTVRKWLDQWVPIWALPDGSYGNGIWVGHKLNGTYSCAINVCSSLAAYSLISGEERYIRNAEGFALWVCNHTLPDGRPIFYDLYPVPGKKILEDFAHTFYTLEALCWTHCASHNAEAKKTIEDFLTRWIFGEYGILKCWPDCYNWLNGNFTSFDNAFDEAGKPLPHFPAAHNWKMAKSNGIPHLFSYYLNHIAENAELRDRLERSKKFLCNPLDARMNGVMSNPREYYGTCAVQATGFAGLTLAELLKPGFVFDLMKP